MAIRDTAVSVQLSNDGHFVYLYDAANRSKLTALRAMDVVVAEDSASDAAKRRAELKQDALLVAYDAFTSGGLHCEVMVGKALTKKERDGRNWLKPQKTPISLPSGRLCVETGSSCGLRDDTPTDSGAIVEVSPGDYLLSLFRIDPFDDSAGFEDEDEDDGDGDGAPGEVIVLTPLADVKAPKKWDPYLSARQALGDVPPELTSVRREGDVFHGAMFRDSGYNVTNLSLQAAHALDIHFGDLIEVTVGDVTQEALFAAGLSINGIENYFGINPADDDTLPALLATVAPYEGLRRTVVYLERFNGGNVGAKKDPKPVSIRRSGSMLERPAHALVGTARLLDEQGVEASILLVAKKGVMLDFPAAAHKHIGPTTDVLTLTYCGVSRQVHLGVNVQREQERFIQPIEQIRAEDAQRIAELNRLADENEEERTGTTKLSVANRLVREHRALTEERDCLRVPEALRPTLPLFGNLVNKYVDDPQHGALWLKHFVAGGFFMDFKVGDVVTLLPSEDSG